MLKKYFIILLIISILYNINYKFYANKFIKIENFNCLPLNKYNFNKNKILNYTLATLPKNKKKIKKFFWLNQTSNNVKQKKNKYITYSNDIYNNNNFISKTNDITINTKINNIFKTNQLIYYDKNLYNILVYNYSDESLQKFMIKSNYHSILNKYIKYDNSKIIYKILADIETNSINDIITNYYINNIKIDKDLDDNKTILYGNTKTIISLLNRLNNKETKVLDLFDKIKLPLRQINLNLFNNYGLITDNIRIYIRVGMFDDKTIITKYKNLLIKDNISKHYYIINITNYKQDQLSKLLYYLSNNITVFYITIFYIN